ncbi:hypothetical protein CSO01_18530 [Cellulomonas soli]|uniref:MmyB-like transcription regulator ligand binding domain-containing protein n=1 Tax=Cellulomonas soli TaxID=931535 RepID=A0A512PD79_9CELL|nr:hypothetical protein CSO01_18530 [Cellulomonas soli]
MAGSSPTRSLTPVQYLGALPAPSAAYQNEAASGQPRVLQEEGCSRSTTTSITPRARSWRSGTKLLTHADVRDLEFGYEPFELPSDPGPVLPIYTVEPNSPTDEGMRLLAGRNAPRPAAAVTPRG